MDLEQLRTIAATQDRVITRRQALRAGVTAHEWDRGRGSLLYPLLRGTAMLPQRDEPPGPVQWGRAALLLVDDADAVLCMGSALRLNGVAGTPRGDKEHVTAAVAGWHPRKGLARHLIVIAPAEREHLRSLATCTVARAVADCARVYDREHAVSVIDSAMHLKLLSDSQLADIRATLGRRRQTWVDQSDPASESPLETRARLFFGDHGLRWRSQVSVRLPDYGAARLDFLIGDRTVIECDGTSVHDEISARHRDRRREDALRACGYEVVRITWADLLLRPEETLARIRAALARSARRSQFEVVTTI